MLLEVRTALARLNAQRHVWTVLGGISLGLGVVGILVPLLPTTPFLILAAYLFSRGSRTLHRWLVNHPRLGPPIQHWREHRAVSRRAKVSALIALALIFAWSVMLELPAWVLALQAIVLVGVAAFLMTRPTPPQVSESRAQGSGGLTRVAEPAQTAATEPSSARGGMSDVVAYPAQTATNEPWGATCTMEVLRARADILHKIRQFFNERGVVEVQTPTLAPTTVSDPHIDSLRTTGGEYLQTSPEYYMKRLLAAGAPSIYQIGPVYRAGESGRVHLGEFTMVEWYRVGFDDSTLMDEVAELVDTILGRDQYRRLTHAEVLATIPDGPADEDLRFAEAIEQLDGGRIFITDFPAAQAALARLRPDNPQVAARFELLVRGLELANGYHELTDAEELRGRMERDNQRRRSLGKPLVEPDERLLAAMRHGLPNCAGVALGLDRLVLLAVGASNIGEVVPFARRCVPKKPEKS